MEHLEPRQDSVALPGEEFTILIRPVSEQECAKTCGYTYIPSNDIDYQLRNAQRNKIMQKFETCLIDLDGNHPVKCSCDKNGFDCFDFNCENYTENIACHPDCPAECKNNPWKNSKDSFFAAERSMLYLAEHSMKKFCIMAHENIAKNTFIGEYRGVVKRLDDEKNVACDKSYHMRIEDVAQVIDGKHCGTMVSRINHSHNPNCDGFVYIHDMMFKLVLQAKCDIKAGTELTYDYRWTYEEGEEEKLHPCFCGHPLEPHYIEKLRKIKAIELSANVSEDSKDKTPSSSSSEFAKVLSAPLDTKDKPETTPDLLLQNEEKNRILPLDADHGTDDKEISNNYQSSTGGNQKDVLLKRKESNLVDECGKELKSNTEQNFEKQMSEEKAKVLFTASNSATSDWHGQLYNPNKTRYLKNRMEAGVSSSVSAMFKQNKEHLTPAIKLWKVFSQTLEDAAVFAFSRLPIDDSIKPPNVMIWVHNELYAYYYNNNPSLRKFLFYRHWRLACEVQLKGGRLLNNCSLCQLDKDFVSKSDMLDHFRQFHCLISGVFACREPNCSKQFQLPSLFRHHLKTSHPDALETYFSNKSMPSFMMDAFADVKANKKGLVTNLSTISHDKRNTKQNKRGKGDNNCKQGVKASEINLSFASLKLNDTNLGMKLPGDDASSNANRSSLSQCNDLFNLESYLSSEDRLSSVPIIIPESRYCKSNRVLESGGIEPPSELETLYNYLSTWAENVSTESDSGESLCDINENFETIYLSDSDSDFVDKKVKVSRTMDKSDVKSIGKKTTKAISSNLIKRKKKLVPGSSALHLKTPIVKKGRGAEK